MQTERKTEMKKETLATIGEIIGSIIFFALLGVFMTLCIVCSDYHWC